MDVRSMPIIRLELDYMKQSVSYHLGLHKNELSKNVNAQIEKAIAEFDFEGEVSRIATEAIRRAINFEFTCGNGFTWIQEAINKAFTDMFKPK
jgi:hypothetical protein